MSATMSASANSSKRKFPLEHTRNIGIVAHIDAGKTTTTERILFYAGVVHKMGEVHEGSAVTDWMDQERERGITITSAAISCNWTNQHGPYAGVCSQINLIDTPGHVDFTAEVERSLRVLDGAVGVFCAVAGVQPQSETVWRQMTKYQVPRIAFVNKMDRVGADYFAAIESMRDRLKANAHPIYIPIGAEEDFKGMIDLASMQALIYDPKDESGMTFDLTEIPAEYVDQANEYREKLIDALADFDDDLADKYLEGEELSANDVRQAIRKATISLNFCGVIPGSAFKNKGVQSVLESVVNFLPCPLDLPPMKGENEQGVEVLVEPDDNAKFAGLAFKLMNDGYVGKLVFMRVYSGTLTKGTALYNPRTGKTERISRLLVMKANSREDIETAYSGDICAIVGGRDIVTGDTLCTKGFDVRLEPPTFPEPVISMSIEPKTTADQEKMALGLQRLSEEDPTFVVSSDEETGQTLIAGMGELHLEIIKDRLFREFKVGAEAGRPQIAYRETISIKAEGEGKFVRQTGGTGQYGHARIKIEPLERGTGIEIVDKTVGGVIPKEFIKPTLEGIREAANNGTVAGFPVVDFKVTLFDGSFHEVDSNETSFKMAGIFAFRDAMMKAGALLLEPVMNVEVETPEDYQGDIMGDLNRRRGQIQNVSAKTAFISICAAVPLVEMFGYSTIVRSLSKGRASFSMEPASFEPVPSNILNTILETSGRAPARN
ncbi:MAG: elongation factor G [Opitutales bacterium]|nr:elongation factor G [Opitutales bacterium]MDP4644709.1 elongation factor G [Opitutales bacterium]MDP4777558.1 elongation factor G [Opitutales bacterium]MDP4879275.1 elongation factor G [Opitutales bacterium]MDP5080140.1 elongation factor G [Opitutales bacterium]